MIKLSAYLILFLISAISYKSYSLDRNDALYELEVLAFNMRAGFSGNFHLADFNNFQGSSDCGIFKSGFGYSPTLNISSEIRIARNFHLELLFGYSGRDGELILNDRFPSFNELTGTPTWVNTQNVLSAHLGYLEISPGFKQTVVRNLIKGPLRFGGGFRFLFPIVSTFIQEERIASPANAYFTSPERTQIRRIASGQIESINGVNLGLFLSVENMISLGISTYLTQNLSLDYSINDVASDAIWKVITARLEIGIRFSIDKSYNYELDQLEKQPLIDTIKIDIAKNDLKSLDAELIQNIKNDGEGLSSATLTDFDINIDNINLELRTGKALLATLPLVNAVFFQKHSSAIPESYLTPINKLPSLFESDPVELHDYLLPRIANIMKTNPKAEITITGSLSGEERLIDNLELAESRAEVVKNRMIELGISDSRINTAADFKPKIPSNEDFNDGLIENSRADIEIKNAQFQEYVSLVSFKDIIGEISVYLQIKSLPNGGKVDVTCNFSDYTVSVDKSGIVVFPVKRSITNEDLLKIEFYARGDTIFRYDIDSIRIADIHENQIELDLSKFEAILRFDYNSSVLSNDNKFLLQQLIDFLPMETNIIIYGSADALGSQERNRQLELERADVTSKYLKQLSNGKFRIRTDQSSRKVDESTPQGRFINRSIRIGIE